MGNYMCLSKCELEKDNELQKENKILKDKIKRLEENKDLRIVEENMKKSIDNLVNKLLENDNINSPLIPDYIEKKIYMNVFKIFIGIVKETVDSINFTILNQNISLKLESQVN